MANSFGTQSVLKVGSREYEIYRLAVAGQGRAGPQAAAVLAADPAREPAAHRGRRAVKRERHPRAGAAGTPKAEPAQGDRLHARRACCCRTSPACPPSSTWPPCATPCSSLGGDPTQINPLLPGRAGHRPLGAGRRVRHARRALAERRARVRAQPRALRVPALGPAGLPQLQGRAARHRHRPPGQPRVPGARRLHRAPAVDGDAARLPRHAGRHRLAHHDDQRPRRARLGRRRHRGRGGHARPAGVDADPAGGRLPPARRAARGLDRDRPGADRHRRCCARRAWSASSSSSSARASPRCRWPTARPSPTWRPSTARPAASSRSTTRPCATCASPGRSAEQVALVEAYSKEQGLFHDRERRRRLLRHARAGPRQVEPSVAGPEAPAGPRRLFDAKTSFEAGAAVAGQAQEAGRRGSKTQHRRGRDRRRRRRPSCSTARSSSPPSPAAPTPPTRR